MRVKDVSSNTADSVMGVGAFTRHGFVIHTTDGLGSLSWLQGGSAASGRPASADYYVTRIGETYKLTPSGRYAYHAGQSSLTSNVNSGLDVNKHYIGIELENADSQGQCVQDIQYQACAEIIRREAAANNMSPIKLYGHANIALPFGRRSDPVRFDYGKLFYYCANPTAFMRA